MKAIAIHCVSDIIFRKKKYPILDAYVKEGNDDFMVTSTFGAESLSNALLDTDCNPVDKEARFIDNGIYAYLPDELFGKPHQDIIDYINKHID